MPPNNKPCILIRYNHAGETRNDLIEGTLETFNLEDFLKTRSTKSNQIISMTQVIPDKDPNDPNKLIWPNIVCHSIP